MEESLYFDNYDDDSYSPPSTPGLYRIPHPLPEEEEEMILRLQSSLVESGHRV